jgi:hypothetical protein
MVRYKVVWVAHSFAGVSGGPPETGRMISAPFPELSVLALPKSPLFTMSISRGFLPNDTDIERNRNVVKDKKPEREIFFQGKFVSAQATRSTGAEM